jgi:hypothetical protein
MPKMVILGKALLRAFGTMWIAAWWLILQQ